MDERIKAAIDRLVEVGNRQAISPNENGDDVDEDDDHIATIEESLSDLYVESIKQTEIMHTLANYGRQREDLLTERNLLYAEQIKKSKPKPENILLGIVIWLVLLGALVLEVHFGIKHW